LWDTVRIQSAGTAKRRSADTDVGIEGRARALIHDQQGQPAASTLRCTHTKVRIVAAGGDELISAASEVLQQFFDVPGWIGVSRAGRVDAIGETIVAVWAPSVKR
jgi:hypothetical protein